MRRACARSQLSSAACWGCRLAPCPDDKWEVHVAPLYLWAATTDGNLAINGTGDIPVYIDFSDAASKLAGAFSFHGEARKGPVGVLGDINFMRLSTGVGYTTPIVNAPIAGTSSSTRSSSTGK